MWNSRRGNNSFHLSLETLEIFLKLINNQNKINTSQNESQWNSFLVTSQKSRVKTLNYRFNTNYVRFIVWSIGVVQWSGRNSLITIVFFHSLLFTVSYYVLCVLKTLTDWVKFVFDQYEHIQTSWRPAGWQVKVIFNFCQTYLGKLRLFIVRKICGWWIKPKVYGRC